MQEVWLGKYFLASSGVTVGSRKACPFLPMLSWLLGQFAGVACAARSQPPISPDNLKGNIGLFLACLTCGAALPLQSMALALPFHLPFLCQLKAFQCTTCKIHTEESKKESHLQCSCIHGVNCDGLQSGVRRRVCARTTEYLAESCRASMTRVISSMLRPTDAG